MPVQNLVQRAFAAGELGPAFHARADLDLYARALKTCRNFTVLRSGGVANRAGTRFIAEAKDSTGLVKLYPWVFTAAGDSTLIEAGDEYFRFYKNGAPVLVTEVDAYDGGDSYVVGDLVSDSGANFYCIADAAPGDDPTDPAFWYPLTGDIYEIPTPYAAESFNSPGPLRFSQNGAEILITHTAYRPAILANLAGVNDPNPKWTLTPLVTAPGIPAPAGLGATAGGTGGGLAPSYVVTAVMAETLEESLPSTPAAIVNGDPPTEAAPNMLAWTTVTGAVEYRIYLDPYGNGVFGYIGTALGQVTYADTGFAADFLNTPPQARDLFATTLNYPEVCAHYQQRRIVAYTDNQPATLWTSRTGFPKNFSIRSPLQDDDAITATLAGTDMNVIRHVLGLRRLVVLTDGGEFVARGDAQGALTPLSIASLDQPGYNGASRAFPAIVGSTAIYVGSTGNTVRRLLFDETVADGLTGGDLTIFAGHLFEDYTLGRLAFQRAPASIVWSTRSDGTLLGLTYLPEDNTFGWHRHDTAGGVIEDICVVPEADGDVLYMVVAREIDGEDLRYIEKLERRPLQFTDANVADEAFFVDCGITYEGTSTVDIDGLDHLEGLAVYALAGGLVQGPFTVSDGAITLTTAATVAHVGLRITAHLETLDLDVHGTGLRDRVKRVQSLGVIVQASKSGFYAGRTTSTLRRFRRESFLPATGIFSGYSEVNLDAAFESTGRTIIAHTDPTPLTILGLIPRFEVGG